MICSAYISEVLNNSVERLCEDYVRIQAMENLNHPSNSKRKTKQGQHNTSFENLKKDLRNNHPHGGQH